MRVCETALVKSDWHQEISKCADISPVDHGLCQNENVVA